MGRARNGRLATAPGRVLPRIISLRQLANGYDENPPVDVPRPKTRGDCAEVPRPCPFVSCRHHLYLDVNDETGSIKLNFPSLEPGDLAESCSLDVADLGGMTLEDVGAIMNLTRERIRQYETRVIERLQKRSGRLRRLNKEW